MTNQNTMSPDILASFNTERNLILRYKDMGSATESEKALKMLEHSIAVNDPTFLDECIAPKTTGFDVNQRLHFPDNDLPDGQEHEHTLLHWAVFWRSQTLVEWLLDRGADPNSKGIDDITPLHVALPDNRLETSGTQIMNILLGAGARPDNKDKNGWTPLHYACDKGDVVAVDEMVSFDGADLSVADEDNATPLHLAVRSNEDTNCVWALLAAGAEVNAQDEAGKTPLALAVEDGKELFIHPLLNHHADVGLSDKSGVAPIDLQIARVDDERRRLSYFNDASCMHNSLMSNTVIALREFLEANHCLLRVREVPGCAFMADIEDAEIKEHEGSGLIGTIRPGKGRYKQEALYNLAQEINGKYLVINPLKDSRREMQCPDFNELGNQMLLERENNPGKDSDRPSPGPAL